MTLISETMTGQIVEVGEALRAAWAFVHMAQQRTSVDADFRGEAAMVFEQLDAALRLLGGPGDGGEEVDRAP